MKRILSVVVVLFLAVSLRADVTPKAVSVPFKQLPSGHITVQVKINGKGPYQLIFDTGAPVTLLNNRVAADAGLTKGMKKPFFAPFGAMGEVKIKKLEVGGQATEGTSAMVMDHPTVKAFNDFYAKKYGPIDGIVGFPFFARYKTTIDYQAKTITFEPNGFKPRDVAKDLEKLVFDIMLKGPDTAPVVLSSAGVWGVTVAKDKGDEEAGMPVKTVLPGSPADKAGLKPGDRVLTIDGRWTDTLADLFTAAGHVKPGRTAPVVVKRGDKEVKVEVKPTNGL
jgi:hypothetical protein